MCLNISDTTSLYLNYGLKQSLKTCIDTNLRDTQFAATEDKFTTLDDNLEDIL